MSLITLIVVTVPLLFFFCASGKFPSALGDLNCSLPLPSGLKIWKADGTQRDVVVWDITKVCHDSQTCYGPHFNVTLEMLPQITPLFTQQQNSQVSFSTPSSGMVYYRTDENGFKFCNFNKQNIITAPDNVPMFPGLNYFIANSTTSPWLSCHTGQRLNVTVLTENCKFDSTSHTFCGGHGKCAAETWESIYTCKCCRPNYGQFCEMVDGCYWYKNDCQNGGSCVDEVDDQKDPTLYRCNCPQGFSGNRCQTQVNPPCLRNECKNGGTCLLTDTNQYGFLCHCPEGYEGISCEQKINYCASNPCWNGGQCVVGVGSYICQCADGFVGSNCQTDMRVCKPDTCQHGGTCQVVNGTAKCTCPIEYAGVTCTQDRNLCNPSPCLHSTECSFNNATYTCICKIGYTGKNCDEDIDECASSPCTPGGVCVNGLSTYHCICPDGTNRSSCLPQDKKQTANPNMQTIAYESGTQPMSSDSGSVLSTLGIIFIILVILAILFCLIFGGWYVLRKRRRRNYEEQINSENSMSLKDRINTTSAFPGELFGDDTYPENQDEVRFSSSSMESPLVKRNRKKTTKI